MKTGGFSLIEVVVAMGIGVLVAMGAGEFLVQLKKSQTRFDVKADLTEFVAQVTDLITNPQRCEYAIGHGYNPNDIEYGPIGARSRMPLPGLVYDPALRDGANQPLPQEFTIRDPINPNTTLWQRGTLITPKLRLDGMTMALIRDITTQTYDGISSGEKTQYDATHSVVRRIVAVSIRLTITDLTAGAQDRQIFQDRTVPLVVELESPYPLNLAGNPWRVARCAASQSSAETFGWTQSLTQGGAAICSTITGPPNSLMNCPEGTYIVSETFQTTTATGPSYPAFCSKSGCSGSVSGYSSAATPTLVCCPSVK